MNNILNQVSKQDKKWREIATKITGNSFEADDLVQDMYLRLVHYNIERWNYSFIILLLYNLFKDGKKANKTENKIVDDVTKPEEESFTDRDLLILKEVDKVLTKDEKSLLALNYDLSSGKIAKNLGECRIKVYRKIISIRKKVLKDEFEKEYKNRRLKWKKK